MQEQLIIRVSFEDIDLLNSTIEEYRVAVERGTLSAEQAREDACALALGMARFE